ncbi:MAG: hypothetical protein EPN72_07680 [Nevskiaceae bacterium]|nr:MAG: hypothetical protein EPN63_04930 [Nevskiaceae bacterium]TBR73040.1 MAG: hypothetical protein EPN72_07680 [Nevskiaceae bacterium]
MSLSMLRGGLLAALCVAVPTLAVVPAQAADFATVYAAAQAAQKQAVDTFCAWNVTDNALAEAKALHEKGDEDGALKAAQHAQALAKVSMQQCEEQKTLWKQAVVR